jgi:hypothetical protein
MQTFLQNRSSFISAANSAACRLALLILVVLVLIGPGGSGIGA